MRRNKKEEEQVKETSFTNLYENSLFEVLKRADTRETKRLRPVVSTLRNYSSATKQENSKGFDRGFTIWCRIIHNSSPFYVVFIWNGPDLRPTGSEFHSMLVIHSLKHGEEADDDSVEGSHTPTANNFDSYSHEYPILAVNFYDPWCYWSKCLDDLQ